MVFGKRIVHLRGMVSIIFPGRINARENTESFQRDLLNFHSSMGKGRRAF
jgi:hypothetical protein